MILQFLLLTILILINGILSASEIAFLSLSNIQLIENIDKGNKKALKIKKLLNSPNIFLATIQIGITLAGFLASAFAAESFAGAIMEKLAFINIDAITLKTIIVVLVTIILSYFTLVFGELVPKRIGMAYSEKIAYSTVNIINILLKFSYPFVLILTKSTNLILKILRVKDEEKKVTEDEIKNVLLKAKKSGAIEDKETEYILNVFKINDLEANQIMTPIDKVISINKNDSLNKIQETIKKTKFTRFLVYENTINNVIGLFNIKNFLLNHNLKRKFILDNYIDKVSFVNSRDKIDDIFWMMQNNNEHFVIVKNESGIIGIITMEDILEEIVGNIFDEFDKV